MTWEPRPVPTVTPETAPYWAGAADGELLLNHCESCGLTYHYPRSHCPDCLSDRVEWIEASGTGTVYTYTSTSVVAGWPDDDLPVVVAYVELDEGPRLLSVVLDCDADAVSIGTRVAVDFVPTEEDEIAIPVFVPTE